MPHRIGLILLAAGGSSRMGSPKQLLQFQGQTLLKRATMTAIESAAKPVIVVLGAHIDKCRSELAGLNLTVVENKNWAAGMGSSIRSGVQQLDASLDGVILMLCDQPRINSADINSLIEAYERTGKEMVGTRYLGSVGVPALFTKKWFPELMRLPDSGGAKKLLNGKDVAALEIPGAVLDIDTPEDFALVKATQLGDRPHPSPLPGGEGTGVG